VTAEAQLAEARQLQRAGESRAAVEAYRRALAAGANPAEVHLQLGVLHADLGEHDRAVEHLNSVLARSPRHPDALCMLAMTMSDLGRYEESARLCRLAIGERPAFSEAHFNLGLALFELGEPDRARESFSRCTELRRGAPWNGAWPPPAVPALD
jgi:tetratricopeptide (TPR) repeat protein